MSEPVTDPAANAMSLDEVFERHVDSVYGHAFKRCGDRALAEDLTALTFEAASRRFSDGRGHEVTLPWLLVVVRRRLVDHWRSEERRDRRLSRLRTELLIRSTGHPPEAADVAIALDSLSTRQRAALVLRYLDDLSVTEVADRLDLSYKATESLLSRARSAFSISLSEHR